jgi:hypothetical protein
MLQLRGYNRAVFFAISNSLMNALIVRDYT